MKPQPMCFICGKLPAETKTKRLVIDHNHDTNVIRGWLCDFCNSQVGLFESKCDRSPIIVERRFQISYRAWLACYLNRLYLHLKNNTGFKYHNRRDFRRRFSCAFAR
jgi:hypothetical protein